MTQLYTFKVTLNDVSKIFYRTIQITSNTTMARLAYAIIASFDGLSMHLFNMKYNGQRYEIKNSGPRI